LRQAKIRLTFGSYGWSGESVQRLTETLAFLGLEVIEPGLKVEGSTGATDLGRYRNLRREAAERVRFRGGER